MQGIFKDDCLLWFAAEEFHSLQEALRIGFGFAEVVAGQDSVHDFQQFRMCLVGVGHLDVVGACDDSCLDAGGLQ